jgi:hypothetical protein
LQARKFNVVRQWAPVKAAGGTRIDSRALLSDHVNSKRIPGMSKQITLLLAVGAFALPLPAFADCAERIATVESHPAIAQQDAPDRAAEKPQASAAGDEEEVVEEEMVENGESIQQHGGETVHADGGPAAPAESWFTEDSDKAVVLTHLDGAKKAQQAGDEKACLEEIEQAEAILSDDAG